MDRCEEISGCFVVARGDGSELLELAVEILDQMAGLVHLFVEGTFDFAAALGWDHECLSCRQKGFDHARVGIKGFIRQQSVGLHVRQQHIGALQIMRLARGQAEGERVAQGIDQGMDFGAQSALAAADRLVFAVFFWAPALC